MNVILGIDIGGSTTKIVGYRENGERIGALQVKATDQITSLYGAIGNFTSTNNISIKEISQIIITGVGASFVSGNIYDIPTQKVDEFKAIGVGGLALSGKKEAIVVSMGTGTAYVRATADSVVHIGGSGVGGGTLIGLSEKLLKEDNFDMINELAENGNLLNVDLTIQDISKDVIPSLPPDTTASNFGKIKSLASSSDMALGLINMVFQTIGMLAVFACRNDSIKDVVLTGALTEIPQAPQLFSIFKNLYNIEFTIPQNAIYATAIGAALQYVKRWGLYSSQKIWFPFFRTNALQFI